MCELTLSQLSEPMISRLKLEPIQLEEVRGYLAEAASNGQVTQSRVQWESRGWRAGR